MNLRRHRLLKYIYNNRDSKGFIQIRDIPKRFGVQIDSHDLYAKELFGLKLIHTFSRKDQLVISGQGIDAYVDKRYHHLGMNLISNVAKTWLTVIAVGVSISMLVYTLIGKSEVQELEDRVRELEIWIYNL